MTGTAPSTSPHAIVVGLDSITGLQTARILRERGVRVIGLTGDRNHFATRTNACERIVATPLSGPRLLRTLERLRSELPDGAVLVPCTDMSVLTISEARDRLDPGYRFVLADHATIETLMDKACFARHATRAGLSIPVTFVLESRDDARRAARELPYPAIVKPSLKEDSWHAATRSKAIPVADADELLAVYDRVATWAPALLAQEWIGGADTELFTCNVVYDRASNPLVAFVTRKVRQWPPRTGTGCLGEECRNDAVLGESLRLFSSVGYRGLGYVEMKHDPKTGRHVIIEVNVGRPTGRSATAENGGVELLLTAYRDAAGLPLPEARRQRHVGAKWIYLRHDLQAALYHMLRRELTPAAWLRSLRGVRRDAVFAWRDPLPFAADLLHATEAALDVVRGRRR